MKPLAGRQLLLRRALASGVAILAVLFLVYRFRVVLPPIAQARVVPQKRALAPPQGPPMRIVAEDLAGAGRERDDNALGIKLCWCPPGTFHMGRTHDRLDPSRLVGLARATLGQGFWMGKFEVTQAQWYRLMGTTLREQRAKDPGQPRPLGDGSTRDHVGEGPDHPIYFVSHVEAEEFCRRLTETEREAGRIEPGWEFRLPTEAEWEFGCRAGTTTATAFGDPLGSNQANFDGTMPLGGAEAGPYLRETTPVGRYPANGWGLHDLHGNLWEWCLDGYQETPSGGTDPVGAYSSPERTIRGGCWHNPGMLCVSFSRDGADANHRGSGLGFRVALARVKREE